MLLKSTEYQRQLYLNEMANTYRCIELLPKVMLKWFEIKEAKFELRKERLFDKNTNQLKRLTNCEDVELCCSLFTSENAHNTHHHHSLNKYVKV